MPHRLTRVWFLDGLLGCNVAVPNINRVLPWAIFVAVEECDGGLPQLLSWVASNHSTQLLSWVEWFDAAAIIKDWLLHFAILYLNLQWDLMCSQPRIRFRQRASPTIADEA